MRLISAIVASASLFIVIGTTMTSKADDQPLQLPADQSPLTKAQLNMINNSDFVCVATLQKIGRRPEPSSGLSGPALQFCEYSDLKFLKGSPYHLLPRLKLGQVITGATPKMALKPGAKVVLGFTYFYSPHGDDLLETLALVNLDDKTPSIPIEHLGFVTKHLKKEK